MKKEPTYFVNYNDYTATFKTVDKYSPIRRKVHVKAVDEFNAKAIVTSLYDSYSWNKKKLMDMPTGKHITDVKVKETHKKRKVA